MNCECISQRWQSSRCNSPCPSLEAFVSHGEVKYEELAMEERQIRKHLDSTVHLLEQPWAERRAALSQAYERMPSTMQKALKLYLGEGYDVRAIAGQLKDTQAATRALLRRGIQRFSDALDEPICDIPFNLMEREPKRKAPLYRGAVQSRT